MDNKRDNNKRDMYTNKILITFYLIFIALFHTLFMETALCDEEKIVLQEERIEVPNQDIEQELVPIITEPLITNIFSETDIRQALNDISAQCGVIIIPDNTVQGMVTLELKDIPFERALNMLLSPGGYVFKKIEDYYLVGLPDPKNPSFRDLCEIECIHLKYLSPEEAKLGLPGITHQYITSVSSKNLITITAPKGIISQIKEMIKKIDQPPKQVMIEATVIEIASQARNVLGTDWKWNWDKNPTQPSKPFGEIEINNLIPKIGYSNPNGFTRNALITLRALIEKGEAKIRANPKVIAQENETAQIYIGKEKYYSISPEGPYTYARLEMIKSGINLKIKPRINDDEITVEIEPQVSDVESGEEAFVKLPLINNRMVKTKVRVKNSETIIIGGLLQENEKKIVSKIPVLSKVPLINFLFKNKTSVKSENEIVILITPHIIK